VNISPESTDSNRSHSREKKKNDMIRRPITVLAITAEDIADYEDRQAAREQAAPEMRGPQVPNLSSPGGASAQQRLRGYSEDPGSPVTIIAHAARAGYAPPRRAGYDDEVEEDYDDEEDEEEDDEEDDGRHYRHRNELTHPRAEYDDEDDEDEDEEDEEIARIPHAPRRVRTRPPVLPPAPVASRTGMVVGTAGLDDPFGPSMDVDMDGEDDGAPAAAAVVTPVPVSRAVAGARAGARAGHVSRPPPQATTRGASAHPQLQPGTRGGGPTASLTRGHGGGAAGASSRRQ
jgi:hypothetical protein